MEVPFDDRSSLLQEQENESLIITMAQRLHQRPYLLVVGCVSAIVFLSVAFGLYISFHPDAPSAESPTYGNYYASVQPLAKEGGLPFQRALMSLISNQNVLTYAQLWTAFPTTDTVTEDYTEFTNCLGRIWDMYSAYCWTSPNQQCGNYRAEGDCFNREHAWPKSWWGGASTLPAYTDLFHLYPTDGYANGRRGDNSIGYVSRNATIRYRTSNGSVLGQCLPAKDPAARAAVSASAEVLDAVPATCWEPVDEHKGRFARMYFYMETRYLDTFECCDTDATNAATIKPWLRATLLEWHRNFPVSDAEKMRNDIIFSDFQGNRNPFVDHPHWVAKII